MEDILFKKSEFKYDEMKLIFESTFKLIANKLHDQAFTRFNSRGEATGRLAPAYFEAVCAAVVSNIEALSLISPEVLLRRLLTAFDSEDFKNATGPGANTIPKLRDRISVVTRYLLNHVNS